MEDHMWEEHRMEEVRLDNEKEDQVEEEEEEEEEDQVVAALGNMGRWQGGIIMVTGGNEV